MFITPLVSFTCFSTFEVINWKGIIYFQLFSGRKVATHKNSSCCSESKSLFSCIRLPLRNSFKWVILQAFYWPAHIYLLPNHYINCLCYYYYYSHQLKAVSFQRDDRHAFTRQLIQILTFALGEGGSNRTKS